LDTLLFDKFVSGEYWERHRVPKRLRPASPPGIKEKLAAFGWFGPATKPWLTVRDAICDLPDPEKPAAKAFLNHRLIPGARSYQGHTGSPLDEAAKTLKAGDHGVPGGENMLAFEDGRVRYFTVRESARLQTFPDEYG